MNVHAEMMDQILSDKHLQLFFCPHAQGIFFQHSAHDAPSMLKWFVKVGWLLGRTYHVVVSLCKTVSSTEGLVSTDNRGVAGYKIYRNSAYLRTVTSTPHSDMSLVKNTSYCYGVSAVDAAGNESGQSNQACVATLDSWTKQWGTTKADYATGRRCLRGAATRAQDSCFILFCSFYECNNGVIRCAEALAKRGDEVDVISTMLLPGFGLV